MKQVRQIQNTRQLKALAIAGQQDQVKRINGTKYKVKSQSSDLWYDVEFQRHYGWKCSCADHIFRKTECKHILSVYVSRELRNKIVVNSDVNEIENSLETMCKCGSLNVKKDGIRKNKSGNIQCFKCKDCNKKWSDNLGFESNKVNSKIITLALDLYFKGVSLRKVKEHILLFHNIKVSHVAILGWVRKFADVVTPFTDQLVPNLSGVSHVDEMVVHVRKEQIDKGHYQWLWNMMDNTTRFWISSKVSQRREVADARKVFADAKQKAGLPLAVVHDGLRSYQDAFKKEYHRSNGKRIQEIRSVSVRKKGLNQKIERLNGVMRDREKVMRGMDHKESSQRLIEAFRTHYNFIRVHSAIGKTPAEQAGINLDLGQNKIESLIRLASIKK